MLSTTSAVSVRQDHQCRRSKVGSSAIRFVFVGSARSRPRRRLRRRQYCPAKMKIQTIVTKSTFTLTSSTVVPIVGGGVMMAPKRCTKLEANSLTKPVAKKDKRDEGATGPRSEHEARTAKVLKDLRWMVPGERPGGRWMVSTEQLARLEAIFDQQNMPCASVRGSLAAELGVATKQVSSWFRNRRFRSKGHQ